MTTTTTPRRGRRNISENVRVLHNALTNILNDEDRAYFIRSLNRYQKDRNVIELVGSLKRVLDSPRKRQVYPLLRDIIPSNDKRYFEKTWHAHQAQSLPQSSKEWSTNSTTRSRSSSRPFEPLRRSHIHNSLPENLEKYDSGIDISNLKNGTNSRTTQKYPIRRLYLKRAHGTGFGFSMRGGSEHGVGLYVSSVDENSLAEYEGLLAGDHVLSVNEIQFDGLSHVQAVKIIRNNKKINMVVRSVGRIPNTFVAEATYKWIDPAGQRVSPPPNVDSNGREMSIDGIHRSDLRLLGDDDERKVNIFVEDGDKLGLKIRGGAEYGLGIYIAGVDPKSAADKAGLKCGDQIMDVNGLSFLNISHADAVKVLKTAKNMMVTMKDVGRLPFAKTTTDRTKWANSTLQSDTESINTTVQIHALPTATYDDRRNTTAGITRFERRPEDSKFRQGIAGSQLMYNGTGPSTKSLTEEQARQILNDHEFGTMAYYLEEYRKGFITVDEFVLALFSLFNTPAKVSLLTEIRGSILPKDIDRFDDLVLKKEIDAIKTRNMTATSQEDALSIRSYSSSMSSYSERSSSSRSSAKDSHGGADSRPITPPRVPEILPSNMRGVKANNDEGQSSLDKTLTYDAEIDGLFSFMSTNNSLDESQDSPLELSGILPMSSSSPRSPTQSVTNGEITKCLLIGDNVRNEDVTHHKRKTKKSSHTHTERSPKTTKKKEDTLNEESPDKTLSSELPTETTNREKRGFSLLHHSKFKGSYSPNKQLADHSITTSAVLPLRSSYDKHVGNKPSSNDGGTTERAQDINLGTLDKMNQGSRNSKANINRNNEDVEKEIPSSVSVSEKAKSGKDESSSTTRIAELSFQEHLQKPKSHHSAPIGDNFDPGHLEGNQNIESKKSHSTFAPPKPRRSFHLSEDEATDKSDAKKTSRKLNETAKDDTSKKDYSERHEITSGKEEISSVAPPKPKPYHTYTQEQTMKENVSRTLNIDKQDDDYVDIDGMDAVPSLKPKLSSHSLDPIRPQNEYVDIDIKEPSVAPPTMPKPYSSTTEAKITEKSTPSDPLQSNATPQIDIRVLSFENLETPKETQWLEGTSQHQSTEGLGKSTFNAVGKKSNIPPPKPAPYSPTREDREGLGKSTLNAVGKKSSIPPPKPAPYSPTREDHRDGMFLAMEATTSNRSGLERSTSWGDESAPCDSNSLYSVVQLFDDKSRTRKPKEFTSATINGAHVTQPELTSPGPIIPPTEDVNTSVLSIQHSNTKEFCRNDKENDNDSNLITDVETKTGHMVTTPDENQNVTEELHSRSSVRNMINAYNHMSDGDRLRSKSHNDTRSNRKSWDGVHNYAVSDESHTISSLENKRRLKSNSDSNLVNLPKDQQKDIQVKLRASQELLDLRQQSRESSTNNSPRHSIDAGSQHLTDPHTPASDPDHLFRSHHGVGYEVQIEHTAKGLGLSLEDESSANEPLKIKSVKEGPYAAHLSGKLRAGQEVCQINKAPVKGMTNAMTVLTLRQAYSDPDTKTLELVVKDP